MQNSCVIRYEYLLESEYSLPHYAFTREFSLPYPRIKERKSPNIISPIDADGPSIVRDACLGMERIFTMDKDFLGREKRKRRKSYAYNCTEFARRRWIDHFHHFHPSPRKKKFGRTRCYKVARDGYFLSWKEATLLLFPLLPFSTRQSHASILRLVISRPTLRRWNRRFSFLSLSPFSDRNCSLFSKDQITQSFGCVQRNVTRF